MRRRRSPPSDSPACDHGAGGAVEANRLVVTALSTYARGLEVIANAADEQDPDLLNQGQSVLAGGNQLLRRAGRDRHSLTNACALPAQSASG